MTLSAGTRLGPYEVLAPLGAGGMGEVYRAKDTRVDRTVALKVLPEEFFEDAERRGRFEREAKLLASLNHPGVATLHSFEEIPGSSLSTPSASTFHILVMELLEGETLRGALAGAKVSTKKALEWARQIAQGLAAAHEKGIVHRDLKPENVFVTNDGRIKILDFGLAKLTQAEESPNVTNLPTATRGTEPGMVMGTLGYMSPEQVKGKPADARSDIFSFGAILYEMLSGQRAFHRDTAAETISAILKEDPPDLSVTNQNVPPGLERLVAHCLEKNPEQRFHSAHDLAFDLESVSGASGARVAAPAHSAVGWRSPRPGGAALLVACLVAASALGFLARGFRGAPAPPSFQRLTFRRGTVWTARFAPDGQTVVYGAAWENNPIEVFLTRPESPESRPLGLKNASLFGVSPTGEIAVMLDAKTTQAGYERSGTLARVPLAGGSPRPVLENVRYADWGPDGRDLMVERVVGGKHRIEFPIGQTLYESAVRLDTPRVSPKGDAVAFFEQAGAGVTIRLVDLAGKVRTLASAKDWWNLAWSPDGREVVYAAPEDGAATRVTSLQAVSRTGARRLLLRFPGTLEIHDVSRDGRIRLGRVGLRDQVVLSIAGEKTERELSWLDGGRPADLSADGKAALVNESGEGGGPNGSIYLRGTDGSPATLIGEGRGLALSPDGRLVLAVAPTTPPTLVLLPTGPGTPKKLEIEGITGLAGGGFHPDGKRLVVVDSAPRQLPRTFVVPVEGGKPRPLGPAGLVLAPFGDNVSPDGRSVVLVDSDGRSVLCPMDGGPPSPIAGMEAGEFPIEWSPDGRFLYIHRGGGFPQRYGSSTSRRAAASSSGRSCLRMSRGLPRSRSSSSRQTRARSSTATRTISPTSTS
jgi:Tol biopolymer transport system component